jgi:hypothetical protein
MLIVYMPMIKLSYIRVECKYRKPLSLLFPREVIEHKLGIDPAFKPIKQKERRYIPERRKTTLLEVNRFLEAGFIRPVDYPSWLANTVLVEKPDGSWRM